MEKSFEVKTIVTKKYCECGGEMIRNGNVLCTYPPKYSHTCNKCGNIEAYWNKYPKVEYKEI